MRPIGAGDLNEQVTIQTATVTRGTANAEVVFDGVRLSLGVHGNLIGGDTAGERNVSPTVANRCCTSWIPSILMRTALRRAI